MSQPANTISHDAAARVLKLAPADLARLVDQGAVPRVSKDAYQLIPLVHGYVDHLRAEQQRIVQRPTQAEIAEHLDISTRRVRELATEWAIDSREVSLGEWRQRYLTKLREEAAGRAGTGDLDLVAERARLAKVQADRIEMQNAVTRKELAPAELIEEVLSRAGARAAKLLDTIPGELKRRCPQLTADDIATIATTIAKVRNIAAGASLADLRDDEDEEGDADDHSDERAERLAAMVDDMRGGVLDGEGA
ncbi:terminase small subunit [Alicycliphilus denitrificans]|uniref:terminase small subunit n=1 Tax=Alicycliphilus denitrificans TaxID=179636 RepID=UPI0001DA0B48|nr:terminase small subunit [Alicycliphilus denitrificans]ADV01272.1 DNA packaging Nu1 [Alicycliphilus denitrificans BC]